MKKLIKLIWIVLLLVGCNTRRLEPYERGVLSTWDDDISEMAYNFENLEFTIYFQSIFLIDHGIWLMDRNGICYNTYREVIECAIDYFEHSASLVIFTNVERGITINVIFDYNEVTNNFQIREGNIFMGGHRCGSQYFYVYLLCFGLDCSGEDPLEFLRLKALQITRPDESALMCAVSRGTTLQRCGRQDLYMVDLLGDHALNVFAELGFNGLTEAITFASTYFYYYGTLFFEELMTKFSER